jgi:hypothetical protein
LILRDGVAWLAVADRYQRFGSIRFRPNPLLATTR